MKEEIDREKEIIEIRKLYLTQIEKFDSKIYFAFLTLSITLIVLHFTSNLSYWYGIIVFLITVLILEPILDNRRKKKTNELIEEIKSGRFQKLK